MSNIRVDADRFWRDGYAIVKRVFSPEQIARFRDDAYRAVERDEKEGRLMKIGSVRYPLGDLLSKEGLRDIVLNSDIRSIANQILGSDPVYFGNSSFQMGGEPKFAPGWHKDNRLGDRSNRRGLDWTTKRYPIIRFGVYFQDHARYSGGLALRVGSNHAARVDRGKPINVSTEPGDVVVWTLTTTHSGQANRLTFLRDRAVGGRWMRLLPKRFLVGEERERIAAFLTLASDSPHLTRYIEHLKTDRAHDEMEWFRKSRFDDDVWQRAKEAGLTVRRIIPEYGTP